MIVRVLVGIGTVWPTTRGTANHECCEARKAPFLVPGLLSTGVLEGKISQIKVVRRMVHVNHSMAYFLMRIFIEL